MSTSVLGHPPYCSRCLEGGVCSGETLILSGGVYPVLDHVNGSLLGFLKCHTFLNGSTPCKVMELKFGHFHFEEELCVEGFTGRLCSECECESAEGCDFNFFLNPL
jgi:hypothetical protein